MDAMGKCHRRLEKGRERVRGRASVKTCELGFSWNDRRSLHQTPVAGRKRNLKIEKATGHAPGQSHSGTGYGYAGGASATPAGGGHRDPPPADTRHSPIRGICFGMATSILTVTGADPNLTAYLGCALLAGF